MMVWLLFIIDLMGLFFYNKIGSIISIGDLPTTNIIEPLLAPYFYFDNWIEKANRNSKFFPIFYYFYWVYIPLYSLFSLAWTVVSVLFFNIVLRNVTDIKFWVIWFLFILLAIGMNWLTYSYFKKMFRLRRELGKSKGGKH